MDEFITAYKTALSRYVDFSGRTSVGGFWRFMAVNIAICIVLFLLVVVSSIFIFPYAVYGLALILPSLAAGVRRLHDTGKSGWFILMGLIPLVGWIIMLVFYVQPSEGPNHFGQGPED